ncbi:2Fe-2S iron-sulfur cluster-binding protein [Litoribacillus peritrichatus]|uniref:Phenylacetate-CoA oxygenase/reductase subunit PaaK n=1 Tax=Litoribacillus peritrichatus TaxID=718191 RepID=A0ABP7M810_9GAMM
MLKTQSNTDQFHRLRLSDVDPLTADSVMLTFEVPEHLKTAYQFIPGQYLTLRQRIEGSLISRCYSICSSPSEDKLSVAIRKIDSGCFSNFAVDKLAVNDELEVLTPSGRFQLVPKQANPHTACYVGVAGGSGITPIMSMIQTLLSQNTNNQFVLFYANRSKQTMMFRRQLLRLQEQYKARFFLMPFFTEEGDDENMIHHTIALSLKGNLDIELTADLLNKRKAKVDVLPDLNQAEGWYLCGPQTMTERVQEVLAVNRVSKSKVHRELFFVPEARLEKDVQQAGGEDENFTENGSQLSQNNVQKALKVSVIHGDQTLNFNWNPEYEFILNQALELKEDLPHACQFGACGTCKAKVVKGRVRMKENMALDDDELNQGYVLTCQAQPDSEDVVIRYED